MHFWEGGGGGGSERWGWGERVNAKTEPTMLSCGGRPECSGTFVSAADKPIQDHPTGTKHHSYYLCLVLSENHIWQRLGYMEICDFVYFLSCITWMHCKLFWIKAPAKCLNVNVTVNLAKMLNCLCNFV